MSIETLLVGLTAAITSLATATEESNNINRHVIAGIDKKVEPKAAEPEVEEKPKVKANKKKVVEPEVEEDEIDEDEIDEDENDDIEDVEVVEEKPKAKTKTAVKKKVEVVEEDDEEGDDLGLDEDEDEASDITHADVRSIANKKIKGGVLRKVIKGIINDAGYDKLDDLDDEGLAVVYAKLEAL
ncbi:MAG: hypothetical protein PHG15_03760 [Acinetobacter sp.]|uniref:hypothetical protein n=1 Tax=Acinetobacter sp. TaxID=472 RepID=UPI0026033ED0|nr:hypothetical protein [Acinetobacter sp.]MDD2944928.1 hypothetical protein [Acinetobacter sp.]